MVVKLNFDSTNEAKILSILCFVIRRVYQGLSKLPLLLKTLKSSNEGSPHPTLQSVFISPLEDQIKYMDKFQAMMETTLDMTLVDRGEFLIKPDFDEDLQGL